MNDDLLEESEGEPRLIGSAYFVAKKCRGCKEEVLVSVAYHGIPRCERCWKNKHGVEL